MASRRKELQEDAKLRVMKIINSNPQITSREVAKKIGISNGSAFYLITSLIDKGYIKLLKFKESSQKVGYYQLLTPKGVREKSLLTHNFIIRKRKEYEALREEIAELERELGLEGEPDKDS